jgi:hypothetical protein
MGKHSYIENHDYLRLLTKFADGSAFDVNLGRGGANHTAKPNDAMADRISVALENARNAKPPRFEGYGDYLQKAGAAADLSGTRADFLAALCETFRVTDVPTNNAAGKPSRTAVNVRRKSVDAVLPNGEAFSLTVNDRSQSLKLWPTVPTRYTRIMAAAKGLESVSASREDALETMAAVARSSGSVAEWETGVAEAIHKLASAQPEAPEREVTDTKVTVVKKRSWEIEANFANGDRASLTISGKSVGSALRPSDRAAERSITTAVFEAKAAGIVDDETLAKAIGDAGSRTSSLKEFAEAVPEFIASAQAAQAKSPKA